MINPSYLITETETQLVKDLVHQLVAEITGF